MRQTSLLLMLSLCLPVCLAPSLQAQAPATAAAAAFSHARSLYYTPVDAGLQSFRCEVGFDWKAFMEKAANAPVLDDDPRLKYLKSIQLTVEDDLRGTGELHWAAPAPPPEATEESISRMRDGFRQLWSGFFQAWNGFPTGDMVSLDPKATVEHDTNGYRIRVLTGSGVATEQYDNKLLLQDIHVATPTLDSNMQPTFSPTSQGLLVTSIRSVSRRPPATDQTDVQMRVSYTPVAGFQLPSQVTITVGTANFDFHLSNCTVQHQTTPK